MTEDVAPKLPTNRLHPSARRLWLVTGLIVATVVTVAVGVPSFMLAPQIDAPRWAFLPIAVVAYAIAFLLPPIRYRVWRFEMRERDLFVSSGAIFWQLTLIPYDRIQFVETKHGPLDRLFSLGGVSVYTAAGKAITIPGLAISDAERLREQLSRVSGTESV